MDILIGSTLYRNTDGTLVIEGLPQMTIGLRKPGGPLLVNFIGYDALGRVQVKIVDSTIQFNEGRNHELVKTPGGVELRRMDNDSVVFRLELRDGNRVEFREGDLRTLRAHNLTVNQREWRIERHNKSGGEIDVGGKSVEIG